MLVAAIIAALVAVPAIAGSLRPVEHSSGKPGDPGLQEAIGRVLNVRPGSTFTTPPHYVAGVRTTRGLVLLWTGTRAGGTQCTGIEAAFGDGDVHRLESKLAGRTIADNGIDCGGGSGPLGPDNAGLTHGLGLGSVHVEYGRVPARVHAVRVTFEDGRTQVAPADHGWVLVAFEQATRRPGHRPILEQALAARDHAIATKRLDPWEYGGTEPPLPPLDGPGSALVTTIATPSGPAELRLSAPGRGWQRQQCWGVIGRGHSTAVSCSYPAAFDPRVPPATTNNLLRSGPRVAGIVVATATRIDAAWLVRADHGVDPGRVVRLTLARSPQLLVVAATRRGADTLVGIVTTRDRRIVGALLLKGRPDLPSWAVTAPCFLAAPSAGAPPATPACRALMATAARKQGLVGP